MPLQVAALRGLGIYRPERRVPNSQLGFDATDADVWIRKRTGIQERRYAAPDESVISMAVDAGREALAVADVPPDCVGTLILATSTYQQLTPPAATSVAHQLGLSGSAAFDISAGCAGFGHALALASDLVAAGTCQHVLVIASELMSANIDPNDVATAPLFGDGAGAVVVSVAEEQGIGPVVWGSDGASQDMITQSPTFGEYCAGGGTRQPALAMDGPAVYRWARRLLPEVTSALIAQLTNGAAGLNAFIPHQANLRIVNAASDALELPRSVAVATDVTTAGNTSAASIPLAMHALLDAGDAQPGDIAALVGFGAGLCWAGQLVRLPDFRSTSELHSSLKGAVHS